MEMLSQDFKEETKTNQQRVEENIVDDILNNDQTDYTPYFQITVLKTEDEIDEARTQENTDYLEGQLARNARDFETAAEIEAQNKCDLIKSAIDPGNGIMTNEDITPLDHIKTERNEPAVPQLDPIALRGMEHFLGKLKETIIVESDDEDVKPNIESIPEATYTAPEVARPDLQSLLNRDNQNDEALNNIRGFRDRIKTEIDDIIKIEDDVDGDFDGDFDDTEFTQPPPQLPPYSEIVPHIDLSDDDDDLPPPYDDLVKTEPESDDDVKPKLEDPPDPRNIYTLVPPEIEIDSDDDIGDIVGNPNVKTTLPPLEGDPNLIDPNPYYTDEEDLEDPGYTDDNIVFTVTSNMLYRDRRNEIHRRRAKKKALKTLAKKRARKLAGIKKRKETTIRPIPEIDKNEMIVDEDGEVTITEPDNIQVEYKPLVPYYKEQIVQLPPEDVHMIDPRTRNLVLKRKQF